MNEETPNEKWNRALKFVIAEQNMPDRRAEDIAHREEFYHEYLWIKGSIREHLHTLWRNGNA